MWEYNRVEDLYHSGVLGMRWGHHKQASSYAKELNRSDRKSVNHLGNYMKLDAHGQRQSNRMYKYIKKHDDRPTERNVRALHKMRIKMEKTGERRNTELLSSKKVDADTYKVIADILSKGYSIRSKQVARNAEVGRSIATRLAVGAIGDAAINLTRHNLVYKNNYQTTLRNGKVVDQAPFAVIGNKYTVSKKSVDGGAGRLIFR